MHTSMLLDNLIFFVILVFLSPDLFMPIQGLYQSCLHPWVTSSGSYTLGHIALLVHQCTFCHIWVSLYCVGQQCSGGNSIRAVDTRGNTEYQEYFCQLWRVTWKMIVAKLAQWIGTSLFCFFSHLFFFPAILFFSDLFCSIFCSKDPNFAHISPSSQIFMTALLEYFVNSVCSIGVLVTGDCSIRVSRSL